MNRPSNDWKKYRRLVVNLRHTPKPPYIYCGRKVGAFKTSIFHNPYKLVDGRTRLEAVNAYAVRLDCKCKLVAKAKGYLDKGYRFACWCAPALCHCDVLVRMADGWDAETALEDAIDMRLEGVASGK